MRRFLGQSRRLANSTWTRPSVASLFTSSLPSTHGAQGRQQRIEPGMPGPWPAALARASQRGGRVRVWRDIPGTATCSAWRPDSTAALEWIRYAARHRGRIRPILAPAALGEAGRGASARRKTSGHGGNPRKAEPPRHPRDGAGSRHLHALYRAETRQWDAQFGEFLGALERNGLLESTSIVLASDHGEEFEEHGGWLHQPAWSPSRPGCCWQSARTE